MELKEGINYNMIGEGVPFIVMVLVEGGTIASTAMVKSAMTIGMNHFVFVAYSNALSSILLLFYSLIFHRDSMKKIFNLKLLLLFFLLGLTGITIAQNLAFKGLRDSSPIVVCAMGLLLPSHQFFLNLLLRKTNLNLRSSSTQIKLAGVLVSIIGAITVAVYMGQPIIQGPLLHPSLLQGPRSLLVFISATDQWMFGTFLLACSSFFIAIWSMLQMTGNGVNRTKNREPKKKQRRVLPGQAKQRVNSGDRRKWMAVGRQGCYLGKRWWPVAVARVGVASWLVVVAGWHWSVHWMWIWGRRVLGGKKMLCENVIDAFISRVNT